MTIRLWLYTGALAVVVSVAGCGKQDAPVQALEISRGTVCSLDGMTLADYPGPKAQIHYDRGEPDFFCDTMEMFSIHLQSESQKRVRAMFIQDMGKTAWEQPQGSWVDAKTAFYVHGSKRHGSMGPTLAAFSRMEDAQGFAREYGGKVLRFDEVTIDMVALDGGAQHDERM